MADFRGDDDFFYDIFTTDVLLVRGSSCENGILKNTGTTIEMMLGDRT